jgi:hypothetical protein
VLPGYRSRSISLLTPLFAQEGYHFTVLTPNETTRAIVARHRFRFFDTSAALVPNLPWPTLPGRTRISADPDVRRTLAGTEPKL